MDIVALCPVVGANTEHVPLGVGATTDMSPAGVGGDAAAVARIKPHAPPPLESLSDLPSSNR